MEKSFSELIEERFELGFISLEALSDGSTWVCESNCRGSNEDGLVLISAGCEVVVGGLLNKDDYGTYISDPIDLNLATNVLIGDISVDINDFFLHFGVKHETEDN